MLPEYLKYNVTNFLDLHNTIYAAAVATVRLSGARMDRQIERKKLNHTQNKTQTPQWEKGSRNDDDDTMEAMNKDDI